jgi:hypothetical protein
MNDEKIKCDKCDGVGWKYRKFILDDPTDKQMVTVFCNKCHGAGKLDWIEVIKGKKNPLWN